MIETSLRARRNRLVARLKPLIKHYVEEVSAHAIICTEAEDASEALEQFFAWYSGFETSITQQYHEAWQDYRERR